MKIFTIGHSGRTAQELIDMLAEQAVTLLVDVRSRPSSARFPQFNRPLLKQTLQRAGIRYVFEGKDLGGRRLPHPGDLRHLALEEGFRAYASHMATPEFRAAVERIVALAGLHRAALLCAEKDPRQCHRALIADYLTVRGYDVRHLITPGESRRHVLNDAAQVEADGLVYGRRHGIPDLFSAGAAPP